MLGRERGIRIVYARRRANVLRIIIVLWLVAHMQLGCRQGTAKPTHDWEGLPIDNRIEGIGRMSS